MLYAIVALLAVIVDQWVKYWVAGNIPLESTVNELIPGVISVVNVHNSGAAFGFLSGGGARIPFIIICGVFTVAIIIALATNFISNPLGRWSAVFVMAGGIGNCIDRILYGYVQDMFMFEFAPNFPIFNVADIFITVFALLFIVMLLAFLIRCELIAGAVQNLQCQSALFDGIHEVLACCLAAQHLIQINVRCLRPVSAGNFNGFISKAGNGIQHFFKRHVAETICIQTKSHDKTTFPFTSCRNPALDHK